MSKDGREGCVSLHPFSILNLSSSPISLLSISEDPLVGSIAQQLLADKEAHDRTAAEWTRRYAQG